MSAPVLRRCPDLGAATEAVADVVAAVVTRALAEGRPAVLGLATGGTTRPLHAALVARARDGRLDPTGLTVFALDEYLPIASDDPRSFAASLRRELVEPLGLPPHALHVPDGSCEGSHAEAAARKYERALASAGGLDLQMLGIGRNGHIGFNEPGADPAGETAVVALAASTRRDAAATFGGLDRVPRQAISMGLGTILRARRIELLAFGEAKAEAVARAFAGLVDCAVPASVLQLHPAVTVWLDPAAAARLPPLSA